MRLFLLCAFALLLNSGLSAQNYYTVKFPDDVTIYGCGVIPDVVYPQITQYGCNFNVGVSQKDQIFYTNNAKTCFKVLRKWTLVYWCDYNPNWTAPFAILNPLNSDIGPTVIGNYSNHGYITYTQIIKVVDNVPPVFLNCPTEPVVFCDLTNNDPAQYNSNYNDRCEGPVDLNVKVTDACSKADIKLSYRLYLDLDGNGSMETYLSSSAANAWPIETTVTGDTVSAKVKFPTGVGLPYGKHKIEWIASDNCAADAICKYEFIVKDCKAPTVVCINGLSINIMQTGMITLWDTDFLQYTFDNCTPKNQLKIAIRKTGAGTGFPLDQHSVTFDCTELGPQKVQIWSQDAYGNADYCETYVVVQDNSGSCPPQNVSGQIVNIQQKAVPAVQLKMVSNMLPQYPGAWKASTNADGIYQVANAPASSGNYSLVPQLDTLASEGVNTLDVLLSSAHQSLVQPLGSPYQIIAADVNRDAKLNQDDINEMMKVITGQTKSFSNNTAWRFVPLSHVFANPAQPLATAFPETISMLNGNAQRDFVGIKTGDLDGSFKAADIVGSESRKPEVPTRYFTASSMRLAAGVEMRVDITTPVLEDLAAFQSTLGYDQSKVQLVGVEPGLVPASYLSKFVDAGAVTAACVLPSALSGANNNQKVVAFTLIIKAQENCLLRDVLFMNGSVTEQAAFTGKLESTEIGLEFLSKPAGKPAAVLMPATPNPVQDVLTAVYYLPEAGAATLRLTDATGQVVLQTPAESAQGMHNQVLDLSGLSANGLLLLQLETAGGVVTQKVMRVR